jgi:heme exporter protein B
MTLNGIWTLFKKELTIELRKVSALAAIILFAIVLVYIIFRSFNQIEGFQWNVLIWITTLFAGVNAIMKSFVQESADTRLYYYTLFHPLEVLIAKLIYNYIFMIFVFLIIFSGFVFFVGSPIRNYSLFGGAVFLGLLSLSIIFTFVSAISGGSTQQGSTLMSILAFPLVIPSVLLMIKIGAVSMGLINDTSIDKDLWLLAGIDGLMLGFVLVLFGELWGE